MRKEGQLSNEIKKLQYQLSYSEHISNQISKLDKQLAHHLAVLYQKIGTPPARIQQAGNIDVINTQIHLQELYYVEPLLLCYEQSVHLLRTELEQSQQDAEAIKQHTEKILKENQFLRKQLQMKITLLSQSQNMGINANFLTLENQTLKQKLSTVDLKVEYLDKRNKQLVAELDHVNQQKRGLLAQGEAQKLVDNERQQIKFKEIEILDLKNSVEILKNQLSNEKVLLSEAEKKNTSLEADLNKLRGEIKVLKQKFENSENLHENTNENLQLEIEHLKEQLKIAQGREQDSFNKCMALESELQDRNNKAHNLNVQNSQLQANNNNMLQMLESYEIKVSTLNKKIKKLEAESKELADQKSELQKNVEINDWKLTEKQEQVERKESQWKKQRVRITKMWEQRLQNQKKSMQNYVLPTGQ